MPEAKQRSEDREITRQMMESELEMLKALKRTTDSSKSQASTHRSLIVNSVNMPPAGPMAVSYTHLTLPTKRIV